MRKIKIPNRLITDTRLSFSARRLGAFLCAVSNRLGLTQRSLVMLSGISGLSVSTVRSASDELERAGYLTRQRTYKYDTGRKGLVYAKTIYRINKSAGAFTLVPADLLRNKQIGGGAFVMALYLYYQGAKKKRAFPSIRKMMEAVGVAKSTVCRALRQLRTAGLFLVRNCLRANRSFTSNSYYYLRRSDATATPAADGYILVCPTEIVHPPLPLGQDRGVVPNLANMV